MTTLYDRLLEVCRDQGIEYPKVKDICEVCKLSSGRPKQIYDKGEAARLGAKTIQLLVGMGYSPAWIQEGRKPKMIDGKEPEHLGSYQNKQEPSDARRDSLLATWGRLSTNGKSLLLATACALEKELERIEQTHDIDTTGVEKYSIAVGDVIGKSISTVKSNKN